MKKRLGMVLMVAVLTMGCGASLAAILAATISGVQDAMLILDQVSSFVDTYFATKPAPELQAKIDTAFEKCNKALNIINRTAQGGQDVQNKNMQAAMKDFQAAFLDLMDLVGPLGCQVAGGKYKGTPATLTVNRPMLMAQK